MPNKRSSDPLCRRNVRCAFRTLGGVNIPPRIKQHISLDTSRCSDCLCVEM